MFNDKKKEIRESCGDFLPYKRKEKKRRRQTVVVSRIALQNTSKRALLGPKSSRYALLGSIYAFGNKGGWPEFWPEIGDGAGVTFSGEGC